MTSQPRRRDLIWRSMSAPPLKVCPQDLCGQKKWGHGAVTKKIGAGAGLLFKGDGLGNGAIIKDRVNHGLAVGNLCWELKT